MIVATVIAVLALGAPTPKQLDRLKQPSVTDTLGKKDRSIANRLHAFILTKQRRAKSYAMRLAERIVLEARRNRIPVTVFASIAWNESWYWRKVRGTSHEYGIWQIWPYSKAIRLAWDTLRKQNRIGTFPNKSWKSLGRKGRKQVLGSIDVSTALAALLVRGLVSWCKRKHRVKRHRMLGSRGHKYWIDRYAHYNSGRAWPKPVYYYQLRRHTRILQRVLATPLKR